MPPSLSRSLSATHGNNTTCMPLSFREKETEGKKRYVIGDIFVKKS